MAKITEEQKAINKAATKLRDAAYRKSIAEYMAERNAAKLRAEQDPVAAIALNASRMLDNALAKRDTDLNDIAVQIRALEEKKEAVHQNHKAIINVAKEQQTKAWGDKHKLESELQEAVNLKYPDVAGYPSAATWKPISEFMVNNDQAGGQ